ncbi:MAG: helix-turn-helix transcriptional regulator [Chloroflexi bacterium]|nr:helix-turn-helix transcriptional regulator [Chloroflexota bacterium]
MNDDFPILAAVAAHPAHPYQLLDHLNMLGVKATRSTLYRRVDALIATGLLEAHEERGERGHPRRALHLTEAGKRRVAEDAVDVIRKEPLESPFFALALNCAQATDTNVLPGLLRMRMSGVARKLTDEERQLALSPQEGDYWSRAGRERRVAHLRADIAWLQSVLGRRDTPPVAPGHTRRAAG